LAAVEKLGETPTRKPVSSNRGATEAELTQAAGPPTERLTTLDDWCKKAGGSRELLYTVRGRFLGGWLPDLRMSAVAFCIDDSSKVVDMAFIHWD
jgi:hypothetical protein